MEQNTAVDAVKNVNISGQLSKKRTWAPIKVLATITGVSLLTGLVALIARYVLAARSSATATLAEKKLTVSVTYSVFGKAIREAKTITPLRSVRAVQLENRYRYMHLLVGFGFLVVGLFAGVHWLLDGLGAGYPYLALIGAGVILGGVLIDVLLVHLVPSQDGRQSVVVATDGWSFRLTGVSDVDAAAFVQQLTEQFSAPSNDAPITE